MRMIVVLLFTGVSVLSQPVLADTSDTVSRTRAVLEDRAINQPQLSTTSTDIASIPAPERTLSPQAILQALAIDRAAITRRDLAKYHNGVTTSITDANLRDIRPSDVIVETTGSAVTERTANDGTHRYRLPLTFKELRLKDDGSIMQLAYTPEVIPRSALRYFGDRNTYVARLGLGIFQENPSGTLKLNQPVSIALSSVSLNGIDPENLEFDRINLFQDVEVTAANLDAPSLLSIRPNFQPKGFDVAVPVGDRPRLLVSFDQARIPGLGLATAVANIKVENVENPLGMQISMRLNGAGKMSNQGHVTLDRSGSGVLSVRSIGFGAGRLSSTEPVFESVIDDAIEFVVPWLFIVSIFAGGVAGTIVTKRGRKAWLRAVVVGVVTGIVVVTAYAVGINLLGVKPTATTGEALAFALAALGAAAGPTVLKIGSSE